MFVAKDSKNTIYYQVALTPIEYADGSNRVLERKLATLKKINALDWLLEEKN